MSGKEKLTIERIGGDSPILQAVIELHRTDGQNLGMFPKGAFREHADRKWILAAQDDKKNLLGYLLYREAKQRDRSFVRWPSSPLPRCRQSVGGETQGTNEAPPRNRALVPT